MNSPGPGDDFVLAETASFSVKNLIHVVRGEQVILDSDLANLYGVETKVFNQAVKRNETRFPERFRFQLTTEEFDSLRSQIVTSNGGRGGRRYLPYAFSEQGIAMLSAVLRSDTAVEVSIKIMDAFVEMRRFLASNTQLFEQLRKMDVRQRIDQDRNEERFNELFGLLEAREEPNQYIFFDGQVYDALELLANIVGRAEREIVLVDGYVDLGTLNILAKKREGVGVTVWTKKKGDKLTDYDVETFKEQYGPFELKHTEVFHDRFLILDGAVGYHVGASLKDAGKKCFGISLMQDETMVGAVLSRLRT